MTQIPVETNLCGINSTWAVEVDAPFWTGNTVKSAPGGAAALTYPSLSGVKYRIGGFSYSLNASAQPGTDPVAEITLSNGDLVFQHNISTFPIGQIIFKPPSSTPSGVGFTIRISPAGVGKVLYLNANVWAHFNQGVQ